MNIVSYTVATPGYLPAPAVLAYTFAANGVFLSARNAVFEATLPLALCPGRWQVRGLEPLAPSLALRVPRIPAGALDGIVREARAVMADEGAEACWQMQYDAAGGGYRVRRVDVERGPTALTYDATLPDVVFEVHSHPGMRAFFSATDDGDETRDRFYGVLGLPSLDRPGAELMLRVGIDGYWWPVAPEVLFDGDLCMLGLGLVPYLSPNRRPYLWPYGGAPEAQGRTPAETAPPTAPGRAALRPGDTIVRGGMRRLLSLVAHHAPGFVADDDRPGGKR